MTASDVAGRLGRLRPRLAEANCEALLVTRLVNARYLTGFTGSAGLLLVLPDDVVCIQGRLNFYNRYQSLLTRMFAIDYGTWYDQFLPGLTASALLARGWSFLGSRRLIMLMGFPAASVIVFANAAQDAVHQAQIGDA